MKSVTDTVPNKVQELLKYTRDLVARGWCQDAYAVDQYDRAVPVNSPEAARWCLRGAVIKAAYLEARGGMVEVMSKIESRLVGESMTTYNDYPGTTQEDVLGLLDSLIEEGANAE